MSANGRTRRGEGDKDSTLIGGDISRKFDVAKVIADYTG